MKFLTNAVVRILKSCKRPIRYLIYNICLCEFTHDLVKCFKLQAPDKFVKKITSLTGHSLRKHDVG